MALVPACTLVNVAEDAELRLVNLLSSAGTPTTPEFATRCQECITAGNAAALLQIIVNDNGAIRVLMTLTNRDEAMAALSVLTALLQRLPAISEQNALFDTLTKAIVHAEFNLAQEQQQQQKLQEIRWIQRKLSLLSILYNARTDPIGKCGLLQHMLGPNCATRYPIELLAPESTLGRLLMEQQPPLQKQQQHPTASTTTAPQLVFLLDSWNVSDVDRRSLYRTIANALPVQDERKQRFLLLLIASYTSPNELLQQRGNNNNHANDNDMETAVPQCAAGAIRDPVSLFQQQRNMLQLPAIQALQQHSPTLYELLRIFHRGMLVDYQNFIQQHATTSATGDADAEQAFLQQWGLDKSDCHKYIRILSLCSLATDHEEIPYSVIADTLKLTNNDSDTRNNDLEVEKWVIAAVGSGLLQAKMDQLAKKVMVERCVVRKFDLDEWKKLKIRLTAWKDNVGMILSHLHQHKQQLSVQ